MSRISISKYICTFQKYSTSLFIWYVPSLSNSSQDYIYYVYAYCSGPLLLSNLLGGFASEIIILKTSRPHISNVPFSKRTEYMYRSIDVYTISPNRHPKTCWGFLFGLHMLGHPSTISKIRITLLLSGLSLQQVNVFTPAVNVLKANYRPGWR